MFKDMLFYIYKKRKKNLSLDLKVGVKKVSFEI